MAPSLCFVAFLALLPSVLCCGNMNVALVESNTNCPDGSKSIFTMSPDFGFTLSEDCVLTPLGCVEMSKEVTSVKLHYKLSTSVIPLVEDERDGCELMKNATGNKDIEMVLTMFQFPKSCPIPAGKVCAEGKTISLAEHKDKLPFSSGIVKGECIVDHKEAGKSWYDTRWEPVVLFRLQVDHFNYFICQNV